MSCTVWLARISSGVPSTITRPSCIIVTHWATRSATSMSCSIRISVIDGSSMSSSSVSFTRSARESPAAGSSSIISFGSLARAMPTSSWRCSPCERSITGAPSRSPSPTASAQRRACSRSSASLRDGTIRRCPSRTPRTERYKLSSTLRPRNSRDVWNVRERPMWARLRAGSAVTSRPKSSTVPAVGGNSPEMRLNSVVLPAPLGPRIARRSPGRTSRSTSLTAWTPPKRRPIPRRRRIGPARSACVAGAVKLLLERHLLGVPHPRRGLALLALRVGAVRRRRVRREEAVERLDVRHAVAGLVLDDLLDVDVGDRLPVVVELHVAPRGLLARQRHARELPLQLALVGHVAVDRLQALDQGRHAGVVAVGEDRRPETGDLLPVVVLEELRVRLDLRRVRVRGRHRGGRAADQRIADLLEDQRVVPEHVAEHALGVDTALLLLVLLDERDEARAADADVQAVDVVRDLRDVGRVVLLAQRRPHALRDVAAHRAVLGHEAGQRGVRERVVV